MSNVLFSTLSLRLAYYFKFFATFLHFHTTLTCTNYCYVACLQTDRNYVTQVRRPSLFVAEFGRQKSIATTIIAITVNATVSL